MRLLRYTPSQTRIKFCGLTRVQDIDTALQLQVDALGLVFYKPSPRYVNPELAASLSKHVNQRADVVALVVNPTDEEVMQIEEHVPFSMWQFHGDESPERCLEIAKDKPWIKAARLSATFDLADFSLQYESATGLLLDALVDGYGGGGQTFDWSLIPGSWAKENAHRVVLSGGLNSRNVGEGIARLKPCAVDVSSGIEVSKGVKDPVLMQAFLDAVTEANELLRVKGV